jgi:predicted DNA-binding transcriptional regulator
MGAADTNVAPQPLTATFNPTSYLTILQGGATALAEAEALVIDSDVMYEEAGDVLARVKGSKKQIEEAQESLLKPARAMADAIRSFFKPGIERRAVVEDTLKRKMIAYADAKAKEAERIQREAEEAVRKERDRLEREAAAAKAKADAEAEAKRREADEAERRRKEAEATGNTRAAAAAAAQAAKLKEEAEQKQAAGERKAEELQERAALTSTQVSAPAPSAPRAAGTSIKRPWKARVQDKAALIQSIAANPAAYLHLIDVNESALNKMASAQQKGLEAVLNGVECYQEAGMSSRSRG